MTAVKATSNGAAARLIRAKHREIAIRYRNGKKPTSMAPLRCAEIRRLFVSRYGRVLQTTMQVEMMPASCATTWR
jgi:hypothetical protein